MLPQMDFSRAEALWDKLPQDKKSYFIKFDEKYIGAEDSYKNYKATISSETDGEIQDGHIGVLGQQVMAMEVLKKFNKKYEDRRS